jgi:hypothetical protein
MENQKELALNVQLITITEPHKEHTVLEEFLTAELHKLIPEINNSDINWTDVKTKLGNELIDNNYPTFKKKYLFSLGLNGLLLTGILVSKLYNTLKK